MLRLCPSAWHDGWYPRSVARGRTAAIFCARARAVARSLARGQPAIIVADNAGRHAMAGSQLVQAMAVELGEPLHLV
jgi:hypothetical protein